MASVKDLTPFGICLESCRRISEEDFDKLVRQGCRPLVGDVLIAKDGATALDTVCEVRRNDDVVILSSVAILRPNPAIIDSSYLQYYLDAETTRSYLKGSFISGAAIPRVVLKDLKRAAVRVPSLHIQRRIADILSAYDDLIENSQRRIKILEAMARALYREWFVHFRFPGHESTPRIPSPLGEVPQGWEVLEFRHLFDIRYGKTLPKTEISDSGPYPVYGAGDVIGFYDKMLCPSKCALVTSRGNGSGTVWRTREAAFVTNNSLIMLPRDDRSYWDYSFVELLLKHANVMEAKTGSAQPQVTIENLNYVKAVVPTKPLVEKCCAFVTPIYERVDSLFQQIQNLRRTRDLLLPRLLSGQFDMEAVR
jgi:type I restriction enzyme S subunit